MVNFVLIGSEQQVQSALEAAKLAHCRHRHEGGRAEGRIGNLSEERLFTDADEPVVSFRAQAGLRL